MPASSKRRDDIKFIFDAIRELMTPPVKPHRKIGFDGKDGQTDIM